MVAITTAPTFRSPVRPSRPVLVVLPPVTRPGARTYRRRRLAVLVAALALVAIVGLVATRGGRSSSDVRIAPGAEPVVHEPAAYGAGGQPVPDRAVYVVQPGDTVWSIAHDLDPAGDPRAIVDRIVALNGGAALQPGQRLRLTDQVTSHVVRCPACSSDDDRVVDSRTSDDGATIRRRRECLECRRRFTTYERIEEVPLVVVKRSGEREPFDRVKIVVGLRAAAKSRPLSDDQLEAIAADVDDQLRLAGVGDVASERVGLLVLDHLRELDHVAYMRFASVYKGFDDAADFEREITLLTKSTAPKRH